MKTILYTLLTAVLFLLAPACKKETESDLSVHFFDRNTATELQDNPLELDVSSDLYMNIIAHGKSSAGLKQAVLTTKVNGILVKEDKFDPNGDQEYELLQKLELDYSANAGSTITYDFTYTDRKDKTQTITANIHFLTNTFFSFRFFNFKDKDTLNAGDTLHLSPAYVPQLTSNKVSSMNVFRKVGFGKEELVKTIPGTDFFFYQVGFITQYDFPIPASLPSGAGVMHRFEMINNQNARFVITHRTTIK